MPLLHVNRAPRIVFKKFKLLSIFRKFNVFLLCSQVYYPYDDPDLADGLYSGEQDVVRHGDVVRLFNPHYGLFLACNRSAAATARTHRIAYATVRNDIIRDFARVSTLIETRIEIRGHCSCFQKESQGLHSKWAHMFTSLLFNVWKCKFVESSTRVFIVCKISLFFNGF